MPAKGTGPLRAEHLELLNKVLVSCAGTCDLIAKMKEAGLPVEQAEEENESQRALATGIKRVFFPHDV